MAERKVLQQIEDLMDKWTDKEVRKLSSVNKIHRVVITSKDTIAGLTTGTTKALNRIFGSEDALYARMFELSNTKQVWRSIIRSLFYEMASGGKFGKVSLDEDVPLNQIGDIVKGLSKRQARVLAGSTADKVTIQMKASSASYTIYELCRDIRKRLWQDWVKYVKDKNPILENQDLPYLGVLGQDTSYAHDEPTTIGTERFELLIKEMSEMEGPEINVPFKNQIITLPEWLIDKLNIDVEFLPEYDREGYLVSEKRTISGRLAPQNKKLPNDWAQLRPRILESARQYLNDNRPPIVDPRRALKQEASKGLDKDLEKASTKKITKKIKDSFNKRKSPTKKVTSTDTKDTKDRKSRTITKSFKSNKVVEEATGVVKIPENVKKIGTGKKEKGTKEELNLNTLKTQINRSLPAEVRRNMGRPALINRSGTFSNSVKLVNLRQGPNTIIGEYTYKRTGGGTPPRTGQPGVYQTFEGGGKNIWPRGYDPRPLIAKSIRNLATKYVDDKFTLRRV